MEVLINKLDAISSLSKVLREEDNKKFQKESEEILEKINVLVGELDVLVDNYEISDEKWEEFHILDKKEKLLMQKLFPYYWKIMQRLDHSPNKDLP